MNYMEKKIHVGQPEYDSHFWRAMRGNAGSYNKLELGRVPATGAYLMPGASSTKCMNVLGKESLFRQIGTVVKAYGNGYKILAKDCDDLAMWVPEGGDIPLRDGMTDFTRKDPEARECVSHPHPTAGSPGHTGHTEGVAEG